MSSSDRAVSGDSVLNFPAGSSLSRAGFSEIMNREKLVWYRELLEAEPDSRLFLPYARHLASMQLHEEALAVLRHGLRIHPDFVEARLLLIEEEYKCGGLNAASVEAAHFAALFHDDSVFWAAWQDSLKEDAKSAEGATLLTEILRDPDLSLHEVLSAGLAALRGNTVPGPEIPASDCSLRSGRADTASAPAVAAALADEIEDAPLPSSSPCASLCGALCHPEHHSAVADCELAAAVEEVRAAEAEERAFVCVDGSHKKNLPPQESIAADTDKSFASFNALNSEADAAKIVARIPEDVAEESLEDAPEEGDGEESSLSVLAEEAAPRRSGKCSFRTRSMAEILAEQGDIPAALEIYEELAEAATEPEQRSELLHRIASLNTALGCGRVSAEAAATVPVSANPAPEASSAPVADEKKDAGVLDMLENLALRLENRAL